MLLVAGSGILEGVLMEEKLWVCCRALKGGSEGGGALQTSPAISHLSHLGKRPPGELLGAKSRKDNSFPPPTPTTPLTMAYTPSFTGILSANGEQESQGAGQTSAGNLFYHLLRVRSYCCFISSRMGVLEASALFQSIPWYRIHPFPEFSYIN